MKKEFWEFLAHHLADGTPAALLAVVESHGASPGKAGFAMAITARGDRIGTIGGGIMEVQWVERAIAVARDRHARPLVKRVFHSPDTQFEPSGLICSGWQTILLKRLEPDAASAAKAICTAYDEHRSGLLRVSPSEFSFDPQRRGKHDVSFVWGGEQTWTLEQNVGVLDTVYVVGSGHVGLALTRILSTLDMRVVTFDDREGVDTFVRNSFADQKICCAFGDIGTWIAGNEREYVAVVTAGYKSDEAALRALVNKHVRYIGLMGSAAKTRQIFDDLRSEGIEEEFLRRIHTPIGLPIASHTPAEIAVSIAAEIIKIKNS